MDDKIYFIGLIIIGGIGVLIGLSVFSSGFSSGSLAASPMDLFTSAFAAVETDWSSSVGQFLVTFDNFKNSHQEILSPNNPIKIFDFYVDNQSKDKTAWIGTDHGLFLSRDGGLTWDQFTSSNNEISGQSMVFKVLSASSGGGDFFVSVFLDGRGAVYKTQDFFFHLEKVMDFDGEAAYDVYRYGDYIYFAMSTGQVIQFNLISSEAKVVNVLSSPVLKIYHPSNGSYYLLLKNGTLVRGLSLDSKFENVNFPGGWLFSSMPIRNVVFDGGVIYILTKDGVQASYNGGQSFNLLKHIPILKKQVDALGVNGGALYVVSEKNLYISRDGGENWKIINLGNEFRAGQFYFSGGRILLSM